jgi:MATE family multidrug resistance protein
MYNFLLKHRAAIAAEIRALWRLAWPMLIGQIATIGMSVADVAMTGHASAEDLAAVSLGASVWTIVMVTAMGVMMAVNAVVAHEAGAAALDRIPYVVRQAMWKGLYVGGGALLLANISTVVFDYLMLEESVRDKSAMYVHVTSLGLPAFMIYRALYGYSVGMNQTKPMMLIALGALVFNIFGNWLLIYGNWGFPAMGAVGCAVSTMVGMWLSLLAMVYWIRRAPAFRSTYPFSQWERPHWPEIRSMLKLGWPIGITYFAEVSAFGIIALLIAHFGVTTVAANQIALNFSSLVFMVPLSFGIGLITRVGHAMGEDDPVRARFVAWVGVGLSLAFALLSASCIALFRHQIAAAYTSDTAVQELAAHLLLFAALFQLSDATQVTASSAIRGYKVTRRPMLIHLAAFWGFALPLGCVLGLAPQWFALSPATPMAATGFWIGLVIGLTVAAVALVWFLDRLSKRRIAAAWG